MTTIPDTEQKKLPEGWKWVKLGEICDIQKGRKPINDFEAWIKRTG